jgi:hypothetical protein
MYNRTSHYAAKKDIYTVYTFIMNPINISIIRKTRYKYD